MNDLIENEKGFVRKGFRLVNTASVFVNAGRALTMKVGQRDCETTIASLAHLPDRFPRFIEPESPYRYLLRGSRPTVATRRSTILGPLGHHTLDQK